MIRSRWLDCGLRMAADHMALGAALCDAVGAGRAPATLRFFRCHRALLIGRHQAWIDRAGIDVARRLSGGGTVHVDPGQLCWELIDHPGEAAPADRDQAGLGVAAGLAGLGIAVRFRPGFGLESEAGAKLGGVAGCERGGARLVQGTLILTEASARAAAGVLPNTVPLTSLEARLGRRPAIDAVRSAMLKGLEQAGLAFERGAPTGPERRLAEEWRVRMDGEGFRLQGEIDGD
jgi:lipoate-protein ligase A